MQDQIASYNRSNASQTSVTHVHETRQASTFCCLDQLSDCCQPLPAEWNSQQMRRAHTQKPTAVKAVTACAAPAAALTQNIAQLMASLALNLIQTKGRGLLTSGKTTMTCATLSKSEFLLILLHHSNSADETLLSIGCLGKNLLTCLHTAL